MITSKELQKLGDLDVSPPAVRKKLEERYKDSIPQEEKVISPAAIFQSDKLMTVYPP